MASSSSTSTASNEGSGGRVRYVLLLFTLYQSFLTTGIIYGWPSLFLVLRSEGVYSQLCQVGVEDCDMRTVAMNRIFTLGTVLNVAGSLLFGRLVDTFGPRSSMALGLTMTILGSFTLALADSDSEFWWPLAYIAYGIGGSIVHLAAFSIGNIFGAAKGTIVSLLVAVFSLSSCTFQVVHLLYEHFGASRQAIFLAHAVIEGVNLTCSLWLWPRIPLQACDELILVNCRPHVVNYMQNSEPSSVPSPAKPTIQQSFAKAIRIAVSLRFMTFALYFSMQLWFSRCLMGWMDSELTWKDEQVQQLGHSAIDIEQHLAIFNASQAFVGISAIPFFGWMVAKLGHKTAPLLTTNLLAAFWISCLLVPAEWPLYALYFISGWHRQFFFSSFFVFMISEFPMDVFATLSGFASFLAGLLAYTQNPILSFVLSRLDGNFTAPVVVQLGVVFLLSVMPVFKWWNTHLFTRDRDKTSSQDNMDRNDGAGCETEVNADVDAEI